MPVISRPNHSEVRIFPAPADLGASTSPWSACMAYPYTWSLRRSRAITVSQLFWLFAAAVRAERMASHELADFYWAEAHSRFSAIGSSAASLGAGLLEAAAQASVPMSLRPEQISARFVDEVAIDAHVAFYNLLSQDPPPLPLGRERAAAHLAGIKSLLSWSGMSLEQMAAFLHPATLAVLSPLRQEKRWREAAAEYRELLSVLPEDREIQLGLIDALWEQGATEASQGTLDKQTSKIKPLIAELEALSSKLPPHAELFDALGELNVIRAIAQAKSGDIADALLSVEKALASRPDWEAATSLKQQLHEALVELRKHAAVLEQKLRATPNATLTSEGYKLKSNAKTGDRLAKEYADSAVARDTRKNSKHARDLRFWRHLGMSAPRENFEDSHGQLVQYMASVLERQPSSIDEISVLWEQAVSTAPALQGLEPASICRFLAHRAYGAPWEPATGSAPEQHPAGGLAPPAITLEAPCKQRVEPKEWLLGRQDTGLKLTIAAAVFTCIATVGLVHRENQLVGMRAAASAALQTALERHDDLSVMKAAHDYLNARPMSSDGQEAFVESTYKEVLVHWAFEQGAWGEQQQAVIDQFQAVMPAASGGKQ